MLVPLGEAPQPVAVADGLLQQVRRHRDDGHQRVVLEVRGGLLRNTGEERGRRTLGQRRSRGGDRLRGEARGGGSWFPNWSQLDTRHRHAPGVSLVSSPRGGTLTSSCRIMMRMSAT